MSQVIAAFVGCEPIEALAAEGVTLGIGPRLAFAQFAFDFDEEILDGVEVGAVRRQI